MVRVSERWARGRQREKVMNDIIIIVIIITIIMMQGRVCVLCSSSSSSPRSLLVATDGWHRWMGQRHRGSSQLQRPGYYYYRC